MRKRVFILSTCLLVCLLAAGRAVWAEPVEKPESEVAAKTATAGSMTIVVTDPVTSASVTVPLASEESGNRPLADVNGQAITVQDLRDAVAGSHDQNGKQDEITQAPKIDFGSLLSRLINVELIAQEATTIGLEDLAEIKKEIDKFSKVTVRNLLRDQIWKNAVVDEAKVEKVYREKINDIKMTLVVFNKKQEASKAAAAIKKGKSFDDVMHAALEKKTAIAKEEGRFFHKNELDSAIAARLPKMKTGDVSPVTTLKKNTQKGPETVFAIFRLEERRTVDSPEAREQARNVVLQEARYDLLLKHVQNLYKTELKMKTKLRDSIDYGPKGPGLDALMKDKRILAEIKGEDPVTVADLSDALQDKLYHGVRHASKAKLDTLKRDALEELVQKKVLYHEAMKLGIDKLDDYHRIVNDHRRNVLFTAFIQKAVVPEIKLNEDELNAYYREHAEEYRSSAMVQIRSLMFGKRVDAATVLEKLRKGDDFGWVKANAEGQVDKANQEELPFEEEQLVALKALPEDIQKALEGAKTGDFQLYDGPNGNFSVLQVQELVPSKPLPFEDVKISIRDILFRKKLNNSIEEWSRKLKESSDVKVYLAGYKN